MSWKNYTPNHISLFQLDPALQELIAWLQREHDAIANALNYEVARWEDLRFPSSNLQPGTAGVPTWDNTNGLNEFKVGDYLFFQAQLPHAWKVGTEVRPHFHWQKISSAAGNVRWRVDFRIAKIGEVWGSSLNSESETPAVSDNNTARTHALTEVSPITLSDDEQISDMIIGKISRVAASGTEYGSRAALLEFDIHYLNDSFGSEREFIKGE